MGVEHGELKLNVVGEERLPNAVLQCGDIDIVDLVAQVSAQSPGKEQGTALTISSPTRYRSATLSSLARAWRALSTFSKPVSPKVHFVRSATNATFPEVGYLRIPHSQHHRERFLRSADGYMAHATPFGVETAAEAKASENTASEPTNEMRALFLACITLTRPARVPARYRSSIGDSSPILSKL